jgi:hypothetical protein
MVVSHALSQDMHGLTEYLHTSGLEAPSVYRAGYSTDMSMPRVDCDKPC